MRYIKSYNESINIFRNIKINIKIKNICKKYGIKNYTINEDGSIDVGGYVYLNAKRLTKLPLKFRNVSYDFYCSANKLTSLEGSPISVSGSFYCYGNNLTTLEGCPESVGGNFNCENNKIITFEHLPLSINGDFSCGGKNPIYEVWKLFEDYSKIELFNDYDIIREPNIIILDRLNGFLEDIRKPTVTNVKGYKCI
jgi:hypothetical protein